MKKIKIYIAATITVFHFSSYGMLPHDAHNLELYNQKNKRGFDCSKVKNCANDCKEIMAITIPATLFSTLCLYGLYCIAAQAPTLIR